MEEHAGGESEGDGSSCDEDDETPQSKVDLKIVHFSDDEVSEESSSDGG